MKSEKINVFSICGASIILLIFTLITNDVAISLVIAGIMFPAIHYLIKKIYK